MELINLGKSDVRVSPMGVGAMTWGTKAYGGAEGDAEAAEASLAAGVCFVDTAEMYGNGKSESRVGELTRDKPFVVATKWNSMPPHSAGSLPAALDRSLQRLGRPCIDLYQIHFPQRWHSIPRLMGMLADAVQAGKVRAVGVSNYGADQLRRAHDALAARGVPLASNQVQYSLAYRAPEVNGVLEACRERGVTVIAYAPLAGGALTGKYDRNHRPELLRRLVYPFSTKKLALLVPVLDRLREIGERHGRTPSQVAIRWLIEQGVIPIPGAKNATQARANAAALEFRLSPEECAALSEASAPFRVKKKR